MPKRVNKDVSCQAKRPAVVVNPIAEQLGDPTLSLNNKLSATEALCSVWTGHAGLLALEVCELVAPESPSIQTIRSAWHKRRGRRAVPLIVFWQGPEHVLLTEPTGEPASVRVLQLDPAAALSVIQRALAATSREVVNVVIGLLQRAEGSGGVAGFRNRNLLSTHYITQGFRRDNTEEWLLLDGEGARIRSQRGGRLLRELGYASTAQPSTFEIVDDGRMRVFARVLPKGTSFDRATAGPGNAPTTLILADARAKNADYAVLVCDGLLRLYFTTSGQGLDDLATAGSYIELDLDILGTTWSALLPMLFAAKSHALGGIFDRVATASERYAIGLRDRFRDRIYEEVVSDIVTALYESRGRKRADPDILFNATLRLLYRLLFVLYAEDRNLLPLSNPEYRRVSLTETLFRIKRMEDEGKPFDERSTALWDDLFKVFDAIRGGNVEWNVPAYNGGLFEAELSDHEEAAFLSAVKVPNATLAPILIGLSFDEQDGHVGKIDFGDLGVRHLGTLYEGLLSYSVHIADQDLVVDSDGMYVPAKKKDDPDVYEGEPYITSPKGGRKTSGSYYTPSFVVRRLIANALSPTLEEHLAHVQTLPSDQQWQAMLDFKVVDPAMGSGHFLVDALDTIADRLAQFLKDNPRISAAPIEQARQQITTIGKQYGIENLGMGIGDFSLLRRNVMRNCIYGVDYNPMAVELAKLSLWLHAFVPGLPLSYLGHNLQHGNALIGIVGHEIAQQTGDTLFGSAINESLNSALLQSRKLSLLGDLSIEEVKRSEKAQEQLGNATEGLRAAFNAYACRAFAVGEQSQEKREREQGRGLLEQADGLEQVLNGTMKGEAKRQIAKAQRTASELACFHWQLAFPEVFLRVNPGFDVVLSNPPWEEAVVERLQFWSQHFPGLRTEANAEQQRHIKELEKARPDLLELFETRQEIEREQRAVLTDGAFPGMGTGDPDLYKAFLWRFWQTCRTGGSCGFVSPRSAFSQLGAAEWRREVLPKADSVVLFLRNYRQWVFEDVNPGYDIAVAMIRKKTPATLRSYGPISSLRDFEHLNATDSDRSILEIVQATDQESLCVPMLDGTESLALFSQLATHPGIGLRSRSDFICAPVTELHATNDGKKLFTQNAADHPVFNHLNIGLFRFDRSAGTFAHARWLDSIKMLQARRLSAPSKSILKMMPKGWIDDPETLPAQNARIAFRDVVHATNPRKVWAALVPAKTLLTNKAPYLVFAKGEISAQAYALGFLNSSILDWYAHHRVVLTLNFFIFNSLPVPTISEGPLASRIIELAGRLAIQANDSFGEWGDHFRPINSEEERKEALAEIDALVAIIYGVEETLLPLVFDRPTRPELNSVFRYFHQWKVKT